MRRIPWKLDRLPRERPYAERPSTLLITPFRTPFDPKQPQKVLGPAAAHFSEERLKSSSAAGLKRTA